MPKIHPQKIVIRGRPYTIISRRMKQYDGLCDHPATPYPEIWIHQSLRGERMVETIIHEVIHAALPDLCEETVEESARDLAKILWQLGYRGEWDE